MSVFVTSVTLLPFLLGERALAEKDARVWLASLAKPVKLSQASLI